MENNISPDVIAALQAAQAALEAEWQRLRSVAWRLEEQAEALWAEDPEDETEVAAVAADADEAERNQEECKLIASYIRLFFNRTKSAPNENI